jgi:hypothetical protein
MECICSVTGKPFDISEGEMALRQKFGIEGEPTTHPVVRFRELSAFWQHWNLYKRTCDKTGKPIISVFSADCPYPVWHKDEWMAHAEPPAGEFDPTQDVFPQMWAFFQKSPIAHNIGTGNQNCEYADDWWYSKNCYLCHSGYEDEDLRYCYRVAKAKDSMFCAFALGGERCVDLINSHECFQTNFAYNCWSCTDSAFLFDCRNCSNCFMCYNLRNKQYCFNNEQLTKEEYETRLQEWDLRSRQTYKHAMDEFMRMLKEKAWLRSLFNDQCENVTGNYLGECKNVFNSYFISTGAEDCINCFRAGSNNKDCLDSVSTFGSQLIYCSTLAQDKCYNLKFVYNLIQCKNVEYSAHCFQCEDCFGCCGLRGKKYHFFNRACTPEEYEVLKEQAIARMKETGEYGKFFPGYFAAHPYDESLAHFYWPLGKAEAEALGFRFSKQNGTPPAGALPAETVPDRSDTVPDDLPSKVFWDDEAKRPFQIQQADIAFVQSAGVPLPWGYYAKRLQENFGMIPFDGSLRKTVCAKCNKDIETSWGPEYDGRILCEECYLKEVY